MSRKKPSRKSPKSGAGQPNGKSGVRHKKSRVQASLSEPSRPTVKRLFAVSGNRCAFPGCSTAVVDEASGSILCQICHIKGENIGSARYDASQPNDARQGYENLILLCGVHHKIIDDDPNSWTVEKLAQTKRNHESTH